MSSTEVDKGADDGRSAAESYVVLDNVPSQAPALSVPGVDGYDIGRSLYSDVSVSRRLKDAGNSAELIDILMGMWRPNTQQLNDVEEIPYRQGHINDVEVDEILFAVEDDLKKLLSLIVYNKTGFVAKTAAMDAFTWFCGLDVVIGNPYVFSRIMVIVECLSRVFCKEDICKWIMGICSNNDVTTQSTGLRGIRNMMHTTEYRQLLLNDPNFMKMLDFIKEGAQCIKHADVYVFEIYHTILNGENGAPGQELFLERLMGRMENDNLTAEAVCHGLQCLGTCIRVFEDRDVLMDRLLSNGIITKWLELNHEDVMTECLSLFFVILNHLDDDRAIHLLHDIVNTTNAIDTLSGHLSFGRNRLETSILQLMSKAAEHLPNAFYDDYLDSNWSRWQIILENGTDANKNIVMDVLHKISVVEGFVKKTMALPLPDDGLPFLKMIMNELNEQSIDILHFLWTHYPGVLTSLSKMDVTSTLLDHLMSDDVQLSADTVNKIHLYLVATAEECEHPIENFDGCLITFLRNNLFTEDHLIRRCLPIGLAVVKKLCDRDNDGCLLQWAMDQGIGAFLADLMTTQSCLETLDDPTDLIRLLIPVMEYTGQDSNENDALRSKLFVLTLNAASIFGVECIVETLTAFKDREMHTCFVGEQFENGEEGLCMEGMMVLDALINQWMPGNSEVFLLSLLRVLLVCMRTVDIGTLGASNVVQSFAALLVRVPIKEIFVEAMKAVLTILAAIANSACELFADLIGYDNIPAMDAIWDLMTDNYGSNIISVEDFASVLKLLKMASTVRRNVGSDAPMHHLSRENVDLKALVEAKETRIKELQSIQINLIGQLQDQMNVIHKQHGSSSSTAVQNPSSDVAALETQVRRLTLAIGEKESTITALEERNEALVAMVRDRDMAFRTMQELVDTQHERMADMENILASQGLSIDF